jgi:hypothetical protein
VAWAFVTGCEKGDAGSTGEHDYPEFVFCLLKAFAPKPFETDLCGDS